MKQKEKSKTLSSRLSLDYYNEFQQIANGRSNTETIKGLIRGNTYISSPEIAMSCVELMDSINQMSKDCDTEEYKRLRKAGMDLCRLLSTN